MKQENTEWISEHIEVWCCFFVQVNFACLIPISFLVATPPKLSSYQKIPTWPGLTTGKSVVIINNHNNLSVFIEA